MATKPEEAVFSISVIKEKGKQKTVLAKNAIKRIALKSKWEDLMDRVVDSISKDDLPDKTLDKFQKLVTIDIASSPNGEAFSPDNDELIEVLYDFDTSLKYVTMTFKMDLIPGHAENSNNNVPNAFSVLMKSASVNSKAPTLIDKEKPRFNGKAQTIEFLGKGGYFCPAIIHIVFLSFYSVVRKLYFHHLISIQCKSTQKRIYRKFQSLYNYQRIKKCTKLRYIYMFCIESFCFSGVCDTCTSFLFSDQLGVILDIKNIKENHCFYNQMGIIRAPH